MMTLLDRWSKEVMEAKIVLMKYHHWLMIKETRLIMPTLKVQVLLSKYFKGNNRQPAPPTMISYCLNPTTTKRDSKHG